ncbi:MAG TPA: hypothetical protein VJY33_25625 [Isosphaeraceae bacterium]|nr:hypothetical protein [Isosphaeraceae bacterium]
MNSGNAYLHFDGRQSYIEVPDSPDFSLATTGAPIMSAWIRPATLTFPSTERSICSMTHARQTRTRGSGTDIKANQPSS